MSSESETAVAGEQVPETPKYEGHRLAEIFPLIVGKYFEALVADIKENGLREPIVLFEGKILDGRNRYKACLAAGVQPRFDEFDETTQGNPAAYVMSSNVHRRHLDEGSRAKLAARLVDMMTESDIADVPKTHSSAKVVKAAEALNVSPRSVENVQAVRTKGSPDLNKALDDGTITPSNAAKLCKEPVEKQAEAIKEAKEGKGKRKPSTKKPKADDSRSDQSKTVEFELTCETEDWQEQLNNRLLKLVKDAEGWRVTVTMVADLES